MYYDDRATEFALEALDAASKELEKQKTKNEWLERKLTEAVKYLRQGKVQFAPHTTNSDVDCFLEAMEKWISNETKQT